MAFPYSRALAVMGPRMADPGTPTDTANIDSAFVYETSGDAFLVYLPTPVAQSAATLTLYVYVGAVTGAPTFQMQVLNGDVGTDDERPENAGSNLASSPSTLTLGVGDVDTWQSLTCTVSMTISQGYWLIVHNTHATPASNHAAFQYRGNFDGGTVPSASNFIFRCLSGGYTTDGITTDPTMHTSGAASVVVKFADGSLLGNPYVNAVAHASDSNDRGTRITFNEDVTVSGIFIAAGAANISGIEINKAVGGTNVKTVVRSTALTTFVNAASAIRCSPVTLQGGVAYDFVCTASGATTAGAYMTMGEAEGSLPADVLACRPFSCARVDGATPGSYAADTSQFIQWAIILDDNPVSKLLTHPGTSGGARG